MSKRNLVAVVTVTHNSASVIHGFMDSLLKQTHPELVLYVVDNASSDETLRLLSEYQYPKMVLIPNAANLGVAEGNNIGIRAAMKEGCSFVLLINNDTVFDADLVSKLLEGLNDKKDTPAEKNGKKNDAGEADLNKAFEAIGGDERGSVGEIEAGGVALRQEMLADLELIAVLQISTTSLAQLLATIFMTVNSFHYPLTQQALSEMNIRRLAAAVPSSTQ